jgi:hypothetical protein
VYFHVGQTAILGKKKYGVKISLRLDPFFVVRDVTVIHIFVEDRRFGHPFHRATAMDSVAKEKRRGAICIYSSMLIEDDAHVSLFDVS